MKVGKKKGRHNKVHLLFINETGKVKPKKISLTLVKWTVGIFLFFFALNSVFTYLYVRDLRTHRLMKSASLDLAKELDTLRGKVEEQSMEIKRLQGLVARLNRENQDLKQHIISRKSMVKQEKEAGTSPGKPETNKELEAFQRFLAHLAGLKPNTPAVFHIREPKIDVSQNETTVSFSLFKDTLKKMAGRIILLGIYKPGNEGEVGKVVAYPKRAIAGFKLLPAYGRYFRIERQFLPLKLTLSHPEGVERFSEFHVLVYGTRRNLLFHEQFKAP